VHAPLTVARQVVLHLLWSGALAADLSRRLGVDTALWVTGGGR
jgi:hypothetical protein